MKSFNIEKIMKKIIYGFALLLGTVFSLTKLISIAFAAGGKVRISESGIKFSTGGIGEDEVAAMRRMAKQFSLNIVFSAGAGSAAINVNAVIFNKTGHAIFRIKGAIPLLYVDFPAGKYRILANYQGLKQDYTVDVSSEKNKQLILNWPEEVEEDTEELEVK